MPSSPHIAILSPIYSDARQHGGITPVIRTLAAALVKLGLRVDLLVRLPGGERAHLPRDIPAGLRIVDLATRHRITTAFKVARYLRTEQPRAFLTAGHRFNIVGVWAARIVGFHPVYVSVHNTISVEAQVNKPRQLRRRLRSVARYYRWADGIITVSAGVADDMLAHTDLPRDKVTVIYNPVVDEQLALKGEAPIATHPWFAEPIPVIVAVGRLARQKAFDHLIHAFAKLRARCDCRLLILGEGPERAALENLARQLGVAEHLAMPGFVANPYPYIKQARVLALSSRHEGCPMVLVEALAMGTPVVATDCPSGPREILEHGKYGRLVPVGDVEAMAAALYEQINEQRSGIVFSEAIERFQAARVAQEYLRALGLSSAS